MLEIEPSRDPLTPHFYHIFMEKELVGTLIDQSLRPTPASITPTPTTPLNPSPIILWIPKRARMHQLTHRTEHPSFTSAILEAQTVLSRKQWIRQP